MSLATEFLIKNKKCVIFLNRVKCSLQMAKQLPIATVIRMCVWYTFMLFYMQVCSVFSSLILSLVVRSRLVGWWCDGQPYWSQYVSCVQNIYRVLNLSKMYTCLIFMKKANLAYKSQQLLKQLLTLL